MNSVLYAGKINYASGALMLIEMNSPVGSADIRAYFKSLFEVSPESQQVLRSQYSDALVDALLDRIGNSPISIDAEATALFWITNKGILINAPSLSQNPVDFTPIIQQQLEFDAAQRTLAISELKVQEISLGLETDPVFRDLITELETINQDIAAVQKDVNKLALEGAPTGTLESEARNLEISFAQTQLEIQNIISKVEIASLGLTPGEIAELNAELQKLIVTALDISVISGGEGLKIIPSSAYDITSVTTLADLDSATSLGPGDFRVDVDGYLRFIPEQRSPADQYLEVWEAHNAGTKTTDFGALIGVDSRLLRKADKELVVGMIGSWACPVPVICGVVINWLGEKSHANLVKIGNDPLLRPEYILPNKTFCLGGQCYEAGPDGVMLHDTFGGFGRTFAGVATRLEGGLAYDIAVRAWDTNARESANKAKENDARTQELLRKYYGPSLKIVGSATGLLPGTLTTLDIIDPADIILTPELIPLTFDTVPDLGSIFEFDINGVPTVGTTIFNDGNFDYSGLFELIDTGAFGVPTVFDFTIIPQLPGGFGGGFFTGI